MRDAILELIDLLDNALAQAASVLEEETVQPLAQLASDARARLAYPENTVVAALAGGTGSGKSSLMNAIVGRELAITGGIRPTTSEPQVAIPVGSEGILGGYLDLLGVEARVSHDGPAWLCLIDLPDNDSLVPGHRHRVESILPRVDSVIWVTDIEKYRDASLHYDFLGRLAPYAGQFLFVFNQVDRLDGDDIPLVEADFRQALADDGIDNPTIVMTAADPPSGPSIGIDEVIVAMEERGATRDLSYRKLLIDISVAVGALDARLGGATGYREAWNRVIAEASDLASAGRLVDAGRRLVLQLEGLAGEIGGRTGASLMEISKALSDEMIAAVRSDDESSFDLWLTSILTPRIEVVLLDRARARAALAELSLAISDLDRRLEKVASDLDV
jgi:50S ribosome-binding GTPase